MPGVHNSCRELLIKVLFFISKEVNIDLILDYIYFYTNMVITYTFLFFVIKEGPQKSAWPPLTLDPGHLCLLEFPTCEHVPRPKNSDMSCPLSCPGGQSYKHNSLLSSGRWQGFPRNLRRTLSERKRVFGPPHQICPTHVTR